MKKIDFKKIKIDIRPWQELTMLGGFIFYFLLLIFMLALQQLTLFYRLIFGFLFTFLIVLGIRSFYFKSRPNQQIYRNFIEKLDASSFPSLHTARVTFLALLFSFHLQQIYTTIFFSIIALLIIYSRVHLKKHDWKDLLGGIILGLITFWLSSFY